MFSQELIEAVAERIKLGHTKESISTELLEKGYDSQALDEIYKKAQELLSGQEISVEANVIRPWPGVLELIGKSIREINNFLPWIIVWIVLESIPIISFLNIINAAALLFAALRFESGQTIKYGESIGLVFKNFISLFWISILTTLAFMGGFTLFIIPGFIVSMYTIFSSYVYIDEGLKGFSALARSHQLVARNLLKVSWFLTVIFLFGFVLFVMITVLLSYLVSNLDQGLVSYLLFSILSSLFSSIFVIFLVKIFHILKKNKPNIDQVDLNKKKTLYKILVGISIVAGLLFMSAFAYMVNKVNLSNISGDDLNIDSIIDYKERAKSL